MYGTAYHNTNQVEPQLAIHFEAMALTQDDLILEVYRKHNKPMAWGEVRGCLPNDMHEGSIKRAITNLANRGQLMKCEKDLVIGPYGKQTHRYKLAE